MLEISLSALTLLAILAATLFVFLGVALKIVLHTKNAQYAEVQDNLINQRTQLLAAQRAAEEVARSARDIMNASLNETLTAIASATTPGKVKPRKSRVKKPQVKPKAEPKISFAKKPRRLLKLPDRLQEE
jgi:hypothetical protein